MDWESGLSESSTSRLLPVVRISGQVESPSSLIVVLGVK
jgi:hypothetical protein